MINKNKNNFWSFHENFENYRKLVLLWKDCISVEDMSNNIVFFSTMNNVAVV